MAFLRPKGKIRFRGDSAFYDHKLLDYLENLFPWRNGRHIPRHIHIMVKWNMKSRTTTRKEVMDFYEQRSTGENFTKELKDDSHGGMLSHRNFCENEVDFLISCVSYHLFHLFRNQILTGVDRKMTMNRYRAVFQKTAVRVSIHARRICLAFSTAYNNQKKFHEYWGVVLQI